MPTTDSNNKRVCDCIYGDGACENHSDSNEELREKLGKLGYDHHLDQTSSENLGQYKSKYYCICGAVFMTDGHDSLEIGINARFEFHVLDKQMELITSHIQTIGNEVIGDDVIHVRDRWCNSPCDCTYEDDKNELRAEQRKRLAHYLGGNK